MSKTVETTTYYLYADEGLIGEYSNTGSWQKSYGWRPNGMWGTYPLYMRYNTGLYYYHNDHLGTPQRLTSATTGQVVWSAGYAAFGKATIDPLSTVENNLRFPGQYYDLETNLHYNWNRTYDPGTGRYTQVDPIGFAGGDENLYRYVGNGPIGRIDPWGLKYREALTGTGAAIGGVMGGAFAAGGSVVLDVITGGVNIPATIAEVGAGMAGGVNIPATIAEVGAGMAGGAAVGAVIGNLVGGMLDYATNDSSDDKCEDPCGPDTRAEAYAKAVYWSGVGDSGVPIPWSDYGGRGGPNYTHVKQQGEQYGGAYDQNSKGK